MGFYWWSRMGFPMKDAAPMTVPVQRKQRTRDRILANARRLFRRHGYNGVGIDAIMGAANLTRGGFYAHFQSKEDLFVEVLRDHKIYEGLKARDPAVEPDARRWAALLFDIYLSRWHRDDAENGCSLVALSNSVVHGGGEARTVYTDAVRGMFRELSEAMASAPEEARGRAIAAMSMAAGGVLIARAVNDEALATEILASVRERIDQICWPELAAPAPADPGDADRS